MTAHVVHVFASFGLGGVPIRMSRVINHLGSEITHTLIALDRCFDSKVRLRLGLDLHYPEVEVSKTNPVVAVLQARSLLRKFKPDLLMTYNWGAIEWTMAGALVPRCRQIHCESGFGIEEANGDIARRGLFRRVALARVDHLIVPSETLLEIASGRWRIAPEKILHIPNGVDVARFHQPPDPDACRAIGLEAGDDVPIVGTLAPLRPEKRIDCLVRAFAEVTERISARLAILGDGSEREKLVALSRELGIHDRVIFAGHVERVERVLGALDLFVLSSATEQMPNSLIQAMAAGLPVAATDVGDVRRILSPENRPFVVPSGEPAALAAVIGRLLTDRDLRAFLGRQNHERAAHCYGEQGMLDRYTLVLRECLPALG